MRLYSLHHCGFSTSMSWTLQKYRSEKLKAHLENHDIHEWISFANVNPGDKGCITYNLVYSASIFTEGAVTYAYKLGSKANYEDVAVLLRCIIKRAFSESESIVWPPTADYLEIRASEVP